MQPIRDSPAKELISIPECLVTKELLGTSLHCPILRIYLVRRLGENFDASFLEFARSRNLAE